MSSYKEAIIIIPTFNEIKNIQKMLDTLFLMYPDIHILIIDDGSPDKTAITVVDNQKKYPNLHLIERAKKSGLASAYITGFKYALKNNFSYILEMDCDFSHDPKDVKVLIEAAKTSDLAIGSRYIDGIRVINWPFKRLLLSYLASVYIRFITGLPVIDVTGGFKCFTRRALEAINLDHIVSSGYIFQSELNYKVWLKGLKIKEVPIVFSERVEGQSKMGKGIILEAFFKVLQLRLMHIFNRL